jgi:hypothetical protein
MPRFSLKDLLLGMGLIAVGFSLARLSRSVMFADEGDLAALVQLSLWYAGGVYIGMGAMVPFKLARTGAWLGMFVFILLSE